MAIIIDLGKARVKVILTEAYLYAKEQTSLEKFGSDNQDDYPRGLVIKFLNKKDKLDWDILEELAKELHWFSANRKSLNIGFLTPDYNSRHDKEIFFQSRIAIKLCENGLECYNLVYYRD